MKKGMHHCLKFQMSLVDSRLTGTEDGPFLSQLRNMTVDVLRYGVRIRTGRERLERRGVVAVMINTVLLDALARNKTIAFLSRHAGILDLEAFLEIQTVFPLSPDVVSDVVSAAACRDRGHVVLDGTYAKAKAIAATAT